MATYTIGSGADDYTSYANFRAAATESAGDTVSFRKGDTFRESITCPASGTSGNEITYTAHGTGANPIISGADLKTSAADWSLWDDFETGDFSKTSSEVEDGSNTITPSSNAEYAGTYGARATFDGTNHNAYVSYNLPENFTDITVEFYIRLSTDFTLAGTYKHRAIFSLLTGGTIRACVMARQHGAGDYYLGGSVISPWNQINKQISLNTWYRVKYRYVAHVSSGGHQMWVDELGGSGYVSTGSDFTLNTDGDYASVIAVGGFAYGNTTIGAASDVDYDDVRVTINNGTAYRITTDPGWGAAGGVILQDGTHLELNTTSAMSLTEGQYYYDGANYVWVYPTGGGSPADYTTEVPIRNGCVALNDKNYLKFENITMQAPIQTIMDTGASKTVTGLELDACTLQYAYFHGLRTRGASDDIVIQNCTTKEIRSRHIYIDGTDTAGKNTLTAHDNTHTMDGEGYTCLDAQGSAGGSIYYCVAAHDSAIYSNTITTLNFVDDSGTWDTVNQKHILMKDSDGISVYSNTITGGRHGMQIDTCIGADIYKNRLIKNRDDPIWLYTGCSGTNNIYYNVCSDSGDDGMAIESAANVYNNVLARISDVVFHVATTADGTVIKNNILYQWGTASDDVGDGQKAFQSWATMTVDNNCWYSNQGGAVQSWFDNPDTWTFAEWQTDGYDTNGLNTDPLFTDPDGNDFTLQASSPCKNTGTDVSLTTDYVGNTVPMGANPDMGAYELQISSPPSTGPSMGLGIGMGM